MKGYKGFAHGLVCLGKQYAENTVFEEPNAVICHSGMHFCENPCDVLDHYDLVNPDGSFNEFAEVEALDKCVDTLIRQIRKNKTRLEKKLRAGNFDAFAQAEDSVAEEVEFELVRRKTVSLKPQSVEEAILQMNLIGHQFYVFLNEESGDINVVYRRNDSGYGLIVPET